MTFFQIDRTQFPIGQGGFHATVLTVPGKGRVSMVIDCGGSDAGHREVLIEAFAHRDREHEILAISHFDTDHINGILQLHEAGITFKSVFLPHVDVKSYLLWMTLKLSSTEMQTNEVAQIIQIAGQLYGGGYGPVVQVGSPDPLPDDSQGDDIPQDEVLNSMLTVQAGKAVNICRGKAAKIFSSSQSLTFNDVDWLFRFYSREWAFPDEVQAIWNLPFFAALKGVVNKATVPMTTPGWVSFATTLEAALASKIVASDAIQVRSLLPAKSKKSDPRVKAIEVLIKEIKAGGRSCKYVLNRLYLITDSLKDYNDASMCVYSGPAQRGIGARLEQFSRSVNLGPRALRSRLPEGYRNRQVGWLATGDADFSTKVKLEAFLHHYHAEASLTSVVVLPHHGSRMSYDLNMDRLRQLIVNLGDEPLFIAPADPEHKKYGHPHWAVESICRIAGDFYVVDQKLASTYSESVITARSPPVSLTF